MNCGVLNHRFAARGAIDEILDENLRRAAREEICLGSNPGGGASLAPGYVMSRLQREDAGRMPALPGLGPAFSVKRRAGRPRSQ